MRHRSSIPLMFRQYIGVMLVASMLAGFACGLLFKFATTTPLFVCIALAGVVALCYVALRGFTRVEVDDDEVRIAFPFRRELRLPRAAFVFSSRVVAHSVNLIPVGTDRFLVAHDGEQAMEILLPNLAKKPFDALMAELRKTPHLPRIRREDVPATTFAVPKEEMLGDFRRLLRIFAIGGIVLSIGLVTFIAYLTAGLPVSGAAPMTLTAAGFCALMFFGFGVPVAMTYRNRGRDTPARIAVDGDGLVLDDDAYRLADIRRIVATPPAYGDGNFVTLRKVRIDTDWGRKTYILGPRKAAGIWKTVFADYETFCQALENAADAAGIDFAYDL